MTGTIVLAGVKVEAAPEEVDGAAVTARPGQCTPLAVSRKSNTQIPAKSKRKTAIVCKKRPYLLRAHKTINVSNIAF